MVISPQHWAQVSKDNMQKIKGTWCGTYNGTMILYWLQNTHHCTIELDLVTNTAIIYMSSGFTSLQNLISDMEPEEPKHKSIECFKSGIISKDNIFTTQVSNNKDEGNNESYLLMELDQSILSRSPDNAVLSLRQSPPALTSL